MDNLLRFCNMIANHAVTEILDETRQLADKFGFDGAILYLRTQIKFLRDVRDAQENKESEGEDYGDNI